MYPLLSGCVHTITVFHALEAVIHVQENTHAVPKSSPQVVFSKMYLALHGKRRPPHRSLRSALATSAWSVTTQLAPSREYRDARAYGGTIATMHEMSTLALPLCPLSRFPPTPPFPTTSTPSPPTYYLDRAPLSPLSRYPASPSPRPR